MLLYVHRNRRFIRDGIPGAQDGHLDFHTAPERGWGGGGGWLVECCFTSTETVGLLGTGSREPRTATSIFTQLLRGGGGGGGVGWLVECCFTSTETVGLLGTGSREPRTATSIFTQLLRGGGGGGGCWLVG